MRQNQRISKSGLLLAGLLAGLVSCETTRPKRPTVYGGGAVSEGLYEKGGSGVLPFIIEESSRDDTYGFSPRNPVRIGGGPAAGVRHQQRYLNALRGPAGQPLLYERRGSCCAFALRRGGISDQGQLDVYALTWAGRPEPLTLYLNTYESAPLLAPVGLTAARPD